MTACWPFHVPLFVALCAFLGVPAIALPANRVAQPEYVRLIDWAKARNLSPSWVKRDDLLLLTQGSTRILLKMASRESVVNGVRVWLLHPTTQRDGYVRISRADAEDTLSPLLEPKRLSTAIRTICIDPGHGGKDPGFRSGTKYEKTYTLVLAKEVRDVLAKQRVKVTLTRSTDYFVDLSERPALAKRRGADLLVSLHFNAVGGGSARDVKGAEVYALTPRGAPSTATGDRGGNETMAGSRHDSQNMLLAYYVQKNLVSSLGAEDRGVQRARFVVLKDASMPAILVEGGFLSHPVESRRIYDPVYRKRMAKAIADGIMAYKRVVDPKPK